MSEWMARLIEKKRKELEGTDKWYPDQPEWGTPEATKKARDKTPGQEKMDVVEGINDPAIFKAVFLAGGPGSGKSFIVGKTALTSLGMKVVNSDNIFEIRLKKAGLEMTPDNIYSPKGQEIRNRAKSLTKSKQQNYVNGRLGLIIDGTGKDYEKIIKQAIALSKLGYETAMIFVNTDKDTALRRNRDRSRSLPDDVVTRMWKDVQNNIGKFQGFFGNNMMIIDNSDGSNYESQVMRIYKKISAWTRSVPKNKAAGSWMKSQKNLKEEMMTTADAGIPHDTKDMGPKYKTIHVTDRRRRKDKHPVLLKRFRKFVETDA